MKRQRLVDFRKKASKPIEVVFWIGILGVVLRQGQDTQSTVLWASVLFIQSLPYAAAILVSLSTTLPSQKKQPGVPDPALSTSQPA